MAASALVRNDTSTYGPTSFVAICRSGPSAGWVTGLDRAIYRINTAYFGEQAVAVLHCLVMPVEVVYVRTHFRSYWPSNMSKITYLYHNHYYVCEITTISKHFLSFSLNF